MDYIDLIKLLSHKFLMNHFDLGKVRKKKWLFIFKMKSGGLLFTS